MRIKLSIPTLLTLLLFCLASTISAEVIPASSGWQDITVFDGQANSNTGWSGWYSQREDNEVEYLSLRSQAYDLEAMFYNPDAKQLMIITGYDFSSDPSLYPPGDIFIQTPSMNYVMDVDYSNRPEKTGFNTTYHLYSGNFTTIPTLHIKTSPDYLRRSGGTDENIQGEASFIYDIYKDTNVRWGIENTFHGSIENGIWNNTHHAFIVDMAWLQDTPFSVYNTMECGNDVIRGQGIAPPSSVPEPSTFILLSLGLLLFTHKYRKPSGTA